MKYPPVAIAIALATGIGTALAGCPFSSAGTDIDMPDDDAHAHNGAGRQQLRGRRLASLHEDEPTQKKMADIIERRTRKNEERQNRRLQDVSLCVSNGTYDDIDADVADLAAAIGVPEDRSHFLGGILRLAAHDFMDFDRSAVPAMGQLNLGPDGCLDLAHEANAGLSDLWCNTCQLTLLYQGTYSFMSRADFWVAAANAVVRQTSGNGLDLRSTYLWGRQDRDFGTCAESSNRLPEANQCSEVEETFLDRMGMTWTEAVALIGAHTLGRGDENFSGHDGIWVDTVEESLVSSVDVHEHQRLVHQVCI